MGQLDRVIHHVSDGMDRVDSFLIESNAIEQVYDEASFQCAKQAWAYMIGEKELTFASIMRCHRLLMANQDLKPHQKGYTRSMSKAMVRVGDYAPPHYTMVDSLLSEWIKKANKLGDPKQDHIEFEKIHPFVDGNGRMGRILFNWQRWGKGMPVYVFLEAEKESYYDWFKE